MTIRRGEEWGTTVPRPDGLVAVDGDRALAAAVTAGESRPLTVLGGDLHRSLGAPGPRPSVQRVAIDLLDVVADGTVHHAVAHVVARRSWWRGPIVAVLNVDRIGDWNVAPRAHPNDGRLDVVEVRPEMGLRARWQARGRLPHGTHAPHPGITVRSATSARWEFERSVGLWLDGERIGSVRVLEVGIRPDAFTIHV